MTRKDYIALAAALKEARPDHTESLVGFDSIRYETWHGCVVEIMRVLKADNSRFDRDRFERAAGVVS